jgi:hypothetical protein
MNRPRRSTAYTGSYTRFFKETEPLDSDRSGDEEEYNYQNEDEWMGPDESDDDDSGSSSHDISEEEEDLDELKKEADQFIDSHSKHDKRIKMLELQSDYRTAFSNVVEEMRYLKYIASSDMKTNETGGQAWVTLRKNGLRVDFVFDETRNFVWVHEGCTFNTFDQVLEKFVF